MIEIGQERMIQEGGSTVSLADTGNVGWSSFLLHFSTYSTDGHFANNFQPPKKTLNIKC